jgi:hypothetical protein
MNPLDAQRQYLARRMQAYRDVFEGPNAKIVLADLARFCRATESTFHPEPAAANRLDGRREVWLRINEHLHLDENELWQLKRGA